MHLRCAFSGVFLFLATCIGASIFPCLFLLYMIICIFFQLMNHPLKRIIYRITFLHHTIDQLYTLFKSSVILRALGLNNIQNSNKTIRWSALWQLKPFRHELEEYLPYIHCVEWAWNYQYNVIYIKRCASVPFPLIVIINVKVRDQQLDFL